MHLRQCRLAIKSRAVAADAASANSIASVCSIPMWERGSCPMNERANALGCQIESLMFYWGILTVNYIAVVEKPMRDQAVFVRGR